MNIDKRHIYGVMIDTETANSMEDPICYDISWQIIDSHGRVYENRSFAVYEVFYLMQDLMRTAYYNEKIPQYWEQITKGEKLLVNLYGIKSQLEKDTRTYNCKFICAHNARFDYKSLHTTQRYITSSKYRWFVPFGLEWWDTMKMAESTICKMPTYKRFCARNGYICKNGQVRKTAEILYRFITNNNEFIEEHKALEDVDIERQILAYCVRQKKKMRKNLWE